MIIWNSNETYDWNNKVNVKYWCLNQSSQAMEYNQYVQQRVKVVGRPEGVENMSSWILNRENVNHKQQQQQQNSC